MGIFKTLTIKQILLAVAIALSAVIIVSAVINALPIPENYKFMVLMVLGVTSMFAGYLCLDKTRAIKKEQTPPTNKPTHQPIEPCRPESGINHNLSQIPKTPNIDNANKSIPNTKKISAQNAFDIVLHLIKKFIKRVLTTIKRQV